MRIIDRRDCGTVFDGEVTTLQRDIKPGNSDILINFTTGFQLRISQKEAGWIAGYTDNWIKYVPKVEESKQ